MCEHDQDPSITGLFVRDHEDDRDAPCRYEVRFAFEGETWFEHEAEARGAVEEYKTILLDGSEMSEPLDSEPRSSLAAPLIELNRKLREAEGAIEKSWEERDALIDHIAAREQVLGEEIKALRAERDDANARAEGLADAWREIKIHRASGELQLKMSMRATDAWNAMDHAASADTPEPKRED